MSFNRISQACLKGGIVALAAAAFAWAVPMAQAGAIRYAGKMVVKGTTAAASATASGSQTAVNKIQTDAVPATRNAGNSVKHALVRAGGATANGAKDGGAVVYYGARRTPGTVANGARSAWRAIW
ncbi:MAG: hypothetical protein EPN47_00130 [Acidobacteria bacterium]|nr:MAG: hypothetical protein EPN47_00130 [Acidobacteriota bacterium]